MPGPARKGTRQIVLNSREEIKATRITKLWQEVRTWISRYHWAPEVYQRAGGQNRHTYQRCRNSQSRINRSRLVRIWSWRCKGRDPKPQAHQYHQLAGDLQAYIGESAKDSWAGTRWRRLAICGEEQQGKDGATAATRTFKPKPDLSQLHVPDCKSGFLSQF